MGQARIIVAALLFSIITISSGYSQLLLMPDQGKMHCNVVITRDGKRNVFAITIPETIGSKEGMILNFPSTEIDWQGPDDDGKVSTEWTTEHLITYKLLLFPWNDFVDAEMTITNLTDSAWHGVWSFNCLNPTRANEFKDSTMVRTYMSSKEGPMALASTERTVGIPPTVGIYFNDKIEDPDSYPFISDFAATSSDRTNEHYMVTLAETGDSYMAATSRDALFLFNNLKFKCIHSATNFGNIEPGKSSTMTSRFYFAEGTLDSFLKRYLGDMKK